MNAFDAEGVRHDLALSSVRCAVARVEKTTMDADERVVVVALQKAIAMPIYHLNSGVVGNADVVWLNPYQLTIALVCGIYSEEAPCTAACVQ